MSETFVFRVFNGTRGVNVEFLVRTRTVIIKQSGGNNKPLFISYDFRPIPPIISLYIAVFFFSQSQTYFFFAKIHFFKSASNTLKIGMDPFHYAPSRLRGSA